MEHLAQIVLLLAVALGVEVLFPHLGIPSSLGYLLVGVLLGPHTAGPTVDVAEFEALAEFGVVFLLFSIGLHFSLPQLHALRHQLLGLGTGQALISTASVAMILWLAGLAPAVAFVVGAVFAQSSAIVIGSQLREQGAETSRHGRLGLAISMFQDLTAVPFLVVIPVLGLGLGLGAEALAGVLGLAVAKAGLMIALVFVLGRWLLRPLFHLVAERRSAELFTFAVLLVALLAAWDTHGAGLSLAFGAFLTGRMLGQTEFRHQVESSIYPFRNVLLGLFFVGIGRRFDPAALPPIWHWAALGALLILASKSLIVAALLRRSGEDLLTAWRGGLLLAVGGKFGLALLVIALILRLWPDILAPLGETAAWGLGGLGAAAILWGSWQAMHASRLKMLVAWSTVAQLGYLFLIFPLLAPDGVALQAGVMQVVAHGLAKAAMFTAVGVLIHATGCDTVDGLTGVASHLPLTLFAFALAGVTLMGLPPSGGFLAKWLLIDAALKNGHWGWIVLVISGGLLAAVYVFRVLRQAFLVTSEPCRLHPVPRRMEWVAFGLAAASMMTGLRGVEIMALLAVAAP